MPAKSPEDRPERRDDPVEGEGELHRLLSPAELEELRDSKRRYAAGRRLAALASDLMSKRITDETIVRRLRQLADWYEDHVGGKKASKPKAEQTPLIDDVRTVFDHWRKVSGRKRSKLDERRRKMIKDRLGDFTVEQLCRVIDYAAQDDFWGGATARRGEPVPIEGYMKSHSLVEDLHNRAKADGQQMLFAGGADAEDDDEIAELEERARRLSEEGEIDEANRIQQDIRRRLANR
jgi:hypothetical protein